MIEKDISNRFVNEKKLPKRKGQTEMNTLRINAIRVMNNLRVKRDTYFLWILIDFKTI